MNEIITKIGRRVLIGCISIACIFNARFAGAQTIPPSFDITNNLHITGGIKGFSIDVFMTITNEDPLTGNFSALENTGISIPGTISGSNISFYVSDFFGGGYFSGTITSNALSGTMYENDTGGRWNGFWGVSASLQSFQTFSGPVFTLQPVTVVANLGSNVTFSAFAQGNPTVVYQWAFNNVPIPGATNSSYQTVALPANVGSYNVIASNALGTNTSNTASLSILSIQCVPAIVLYGSIGQTFQIFESATSDKSNPTNIANIVLTSTPFVWVDTNSVTRSAGFLWAIPGN